MRDSNLKTAPDFTRACLVMFGVNITWIFTVIWAIWGLIVVAILGVLIDHMITRIQVIMHERAARDRAFPRAKARD